MNNLSASQSRIQDADYATEVSNMSRANILQQAGTSVLAQANQSTQNVLSCCVNRLSRLTVAKKPRFGGVFMLAHRAVITWRK